MAVTAVSPSAAGRGCHCCFALCCRLWLSLLLRPLLPAVAVTAVSPSAAGCGCHCCFALCRRLWLSLLLRPLLLAVAVTAASPSAAGRGCHCCFALCRRLWLSLLFRPLPPVVDVTAASPCVAVTAELSALLPVSEIIHSKNSCQHHHSANDMPDMECLVQEEDAAKNGNHRA